MEKTDILHSKNSHKGLLNIYLRWNPIKIIK